MAVAGEPDGCGVVAGDAEGDGEGDPVGVSSGGARGLGPERAQRLVDGQEGEQLLAGQVRGLGPKDELGAAQPGLQLAEAVLISQRSR